MCSSNADMTSYRILLLLSEDIWFTGKLNDLNDPQQLEELWAWMMKMQGRLNQFDPNSFSLAWIEGATAGQVIQSMGVGVAPVWEDNALLTNLTLSGLTASQLVATDASKVLTSYAPDSGWSVTAGYTSDKSFNPETALLVEVARVLGSLVDALKAKGILS